MAQPNDTVRTSPDFTPKFGWRWTREQIAAWQLDQLNAQFAEVLPRNRFYRDKFGIETLKLDSLDQLAELPMTEKSELVASADASSKGLSQHHTYPQSYYSRLHRTSGTTGNPLMVHDTAADWKWWSTTWQHVLDAANVTPEDRVFLAFSFGPFIGFWSAHEAFVNRGSLVIPGGGLTSLARLEFLKASDANIVCCTPSYALHLGEVAEANGLDLASLAVDRIIVAGESGGSVPAVRDKIASTWNAQVIDHSGATEIGPWGFGWPDRIGLHVIETSFIAEFLPADSHEGNNDLAGGLSELVITSIGRYGAPVIRYRTGDMVKVGPPPSLECGFLWLPEGVVGRVDNMVTVRGVNVFPSSIEAILRGIPDVAEYRVNVTRNGHLDQLTIEAEAEALTCDRLAKELTVRLGLRIPVQAVEYGSLPRSEGKSKRWVDHRRKN